MTGTTAAPDGRDSDRTEQHSTDDEQRPTERLDGPPAYGQHGTGRARSLYWLLPTLAFVLGLVLGGGVIAVADLGSDDETPTASRVVDAPEPAADGDRTITVPASCVDGLDRAEVAAKAAKDGIDAVTRIDTAALQRALDQLQTLQPQIADLADRCRVAATDGN